jgi:Apea-like HEPN
MTNQVQMTDSEEVELINALASTLPIAAKARSVDWGLLFQITALRDDSALKEIRDLHNLVKKISALEFFDCAYQYALGQEEKVDSRFLVQWLISRGQQVGADETIKNLIRYLNSETIEVTEILAFDGFDVKENIKIGDYELIAWNNLAMTDTKYQVAVRGLYSGREPTAVLIQHHEIQKVHIRPWDHARPYVPHSIEPALDVLRCITAIVGGGFRLRHYWFEPVEWAAWAVNLSTFGVDSTTILHSVAINVVDVRSIRECVSHFSALDENCRLRLRMPLDRLNRSYLAGMRSVDKAIELGIALESLYAPTKLNEGIAFAVRTRAARFLGGSFEERQETVKTLRDVYDLRSRAVHSGRFDADNSKKWRDTEKISNVLEEGQKLVGRSLIKVVLEGEPDWEKFDIANTDLGQ